MNKPPPRPQPPSTSNFIRQIVEADLAAGTYSKVRTRFPPEPNGYLHFGHVKSICLNFGLAQQYGGHCNLRFDDTNPEKEEQEYVDSIISAVKWLGADWPVTSGLPLVFWFGFGVLLLAPLIALWRNVEALAMIYAESAAQGRAKQAVLQPLFEKLLKGVASVGIILWLAVLVPFAVFPWWGVVGLVAACVTLALVFWRKLVRLHSRFELELRTHLADSPFTDGRPVLAGLTQSNGRWELNLSEFTIAENSRAVAQPIAALPLRELFACTIVSIERQGVTIPNPAADMVLFPNDKILLLGHDENLRRAERWLHAAHAGLTTRGLLVAARGLPGGWLHPAHADGGTRAAAAARGRLLPRLSRGVAGAAAACLHAAEARVRAGPETSSPYCEKNQERP